MHRTIDPKTAGRREILMFSLLPLGILTIDCTVYTLMDFYLTDVLKLSMGLASFVLLGTKAWDALNDPMMGQLVERTRTKYGKCRPYLLFTPLPLALITALLFLPIRFPDSWNIVSKSGAVLGNAGNFAYMLVLYMLFITAYTAVEIPYQSLTPLVFPQKDRRVRAVSVSGTLGSLGTVLPSVLIWTLAGLFGNGAKDRSDRGYFFASLLFALLGAAVIMISFFGIREKVYIPPEKPRGRESVRRILCDRRVRVLLVCAFFCGSINIGAIFLPYFARWNCIGILPMDRINSFIASAVGKDPHLDAVAILPTALSVMSGASYMLSMLLVPVFLKKMSKKTLWIAMSFIGAAADLMVFVIGVWVVPYNTVLGFLLYAVLRFFTNFPVGMSTILIVSMLADVTDSIEIETGQRLEATVYSFKGLLYKISAAVFNVITLQTVNALGYNAETMQRLTENVTVPLIASTTEAAVSGGVNYTLLLNGIFFMLTVMGAVGLVLQGIPMLFYRFDEDRMEAALTEYRARREAEREQALLGAMEHQNQGRERI